MGGGPLPPHSPSEDMNELVDVTRPKLLFFLLVELTRSLKKGL